MMKWFSRKNRKEDNTIKKVMAEINEKNEALIKVCKTLRYIAKKYSQNVDGYHMELAKKRRLEAEKEELIALRCHLTGKCIGETFSIPE